jgi:hypothetical protein
MTWMTCVLRSAGITPLHHYYDAVRPWYAHQYFGLAGSPLVPFPFASQTRFSSFVTEPGLNLRLFYTGHRASSKWISLALFPEWSSDPGFDVVLGVIDASNRGSLALVSSIHT